MIENNVVIIGTAKNVENYLPIVIQKMEMLGSLFFNYKIIIYENDSEDQTLNILINWEKRNKNVKIISEKNINSPHRTHNLMYARNILLKEALQLNSKYLICMDMDYVNYGLTKESFLSCFDIDLDWAVLGANQSQVYYDLWALRTYDDWMDYDCWWCVHIENKTVDECILKQFRNIPVDHKPIKVLSCFGGLCLYKTKFLHNCEYNGKINNEIWPQQSEHIGLNEGIIKNGGNIYINPKMINF
jgi:glycosyltransferase involved in cell wall biosynthesis